MGGPLEIIYMNTRPRDTVCISMEVKMDELNKPLLILDQPYQYSTNLEVIYNLNPQNKQKTTVKIQVFGRTILYHMF